MSESGEIDLVAIAYDDSPDDWSSVELSLDSPPKQRLRYRIVLGDARNVKIRRCEDE